MKVTSTMSPKSVGLGITEGEQVYYNPTKSKDEKKIILNVIKKINGGEFGNILSTSNRKIVIKTATTENGSVERIKNEINYLTLLKNNHIVRLLDFNISSNHCFMFFKKYDFDLSTAFDHLYDDKIVVFKKNSILQIFDALRYMHSIGICHNDVKPANVVVHRETLSIRLIDFGFAKRFGKCTCSHGIDNNFSGTLEWSGINLSKNCPSARSDLESFGFVTFFILNEGRKNLFKWLEVNSEDIYKIAKLKTKFFLTTYTESKNVESVKLNIDEMVRFSTIAVLIHSIKCCTFDNKIYDLIKVMLGLLTSTDDDYLFSKNLRRSCSH